MARYQLNSLTAVNYAGDTVSITFNFDDISGTITVPNDYSGYKDFKVNYNCGYIDVPKSIVHGIKMLVSTMHLNREDTALSKKGVLTSDRLFKPYRIISL